MRLNGDFFIVAGDSNAKLGSNIIENDIHPMFQNHGQLFRLILKYNLCLFSSSNIWHGLFTFAHDSNWLQFCFSWLNPVQAGLFWNNIGCEGGGGHCAPLFLLYLWSDYNQTWRDGTLRQNLSKALKSLLTSSLWGKKEIIKLFLVSFEVRIQVPLSFVQWSWNLAQGSILKCWFRIQAKKSDLSTFWRRKMPFFKKNWHFCPSIPWQKCYHGNTLGYCLLKIISNDALYNYTESQKVSSVY